MGKNLLKMDREFVKDWISYTEAKPNHTGQAMEPLRAFASIPVHIPDEQVIKYARALICRDAGLHVHKGKA